MQSGFDFWRLSPRVVGTAGKNQKEQAPKAGEKNGCGDRPAQNRLTRLPDLAEAKTLGPFWRSGARTEAPPDLFVTFRAHWPWGVGLFCEAVPQTSGDSH